MGVGIENEFQESLENFMEPKCFGKPKTSIFRTPSK